MKMIPGYAVETCSMKQSAGMLVSCMCLLVFSATPSLSKEWRGIIPLRTTRADILKLLGNQKPGKSDPREYFDTDNETISFDCIDPTCARKYPIQPNNVIRSEDLV